MRVVCALFFVLMCLTAPAQHTSTNNYFFELKVYEYKTIEQEKILDHFLAKAYLPFLHKSGIQHVGVFGLLNNDTVLNKKLFVLIPHVSLASIPVLQKSFLTDNTSLENGKDYIDAQSSNPVYNRITTYILEGFRFAPSLMLPKLRSSHHDRIYELRSYESASEKKYWKKVEMFNEGGEIDLFARLNFNAIFYAEVISGPTMPNLMYMTSFENMEDRNEHWKAFSNDPKWKELLSMKEYDQTVSKNVTLFLKARPYSDY